MGEGGGGGGEGSMLPELLGTFMFSNDSNQNLGRLNLRSLDKKTFHKNTQGNG